MVDFDCGPGGGRNGDAGAGAGAIGAAGDDNADIACVFDWFG